MLAIPKNSENQSMIVSFTHRSLCVNHSWQLFSLAEARVSPYDTGEKQKGVVLGCKRGGFETQNRHSCVTKMPVLRYR